MNIEIRRLSGKRKACYVDGQLAFVMHKGSAFTARVRRLEAQNRVDQFIAEKRATMLALIPDCGRGVYVEPIATTAQNQAAASIAIIRGAKEADRRFDEGYNRWVSDGMPVFVPLRPSIV